MAGLGRQAGNIQAGILWHYEFDDHRMKNYSMESWIASLEILVRRYNLTAIDIRNEISDEGKTRVTWGETTDPNTDRLAASTLASRRIRAIDESVLIILGGLCWNFDLRAMMKNVGPRKVFNGGRLQYCSCGSYLVDSSEFNSDDWGNCYAFVLLRLVLFQDICGREFALDRSVFHDNIFF